MNTRNRAPCVSLRRACSALQPDECARGGASLSNAPLFMAPPKLSAAQALYIRTMRVLCDLQQRDALPRYTERSRRAHGVFLYMPWARRMQHALNNGAGAIATQHAVVRVICLCPAPRPLRRCDECRQVSCAQDASNLFLYLTESQRHFRPKLASLRQYDAVEVRQIRHSFPMLRHSPCAVLFLLEVPTLSVHRS